ncbi:MAG: hypothetical protein Q9214_005866, partial [Letrouitia sp. 1 TL-2023]
IVHGDVKPQNVLIFGEDPGRYVAKVSDFGFSSLATTDEYITVPRTRPWNGPEWHHRGFPINEVKKMDVYSFGMLCLWLLFKDALSETSRRQIPVLKEWEGADLFAQSVEPSPEEPILETLKSNDQMPILAHQLLTTTTTTDLDQDRRSKLDKFFLCLSREPTNRSTDLVELLRLFASLQTAFCYNVGFGTLSDKEQVRLWLGEEWSIDDLEEQIGLVRDAGMSYEDEFVKLIEDGYDVMGNPAEEYRRAKVLETSDSEYGREVDDMEKVFGSTHIVIFRLKLVLVDILLGKDELERAEAILTNLKVQLENDPKYGSGHLNTVITIGRLAHVFAQTGKYERAEKLYLQALDGLNELLGPEHLFTLSVLTEFAILLNYQARYERAEALCRRALDRQREILGESHITALDTLDALGTILMSQGRYEEAERAFEQEVQLTQTTLGPEDPQTVIAVSNLATISRLSGRYRTAETLGRNVMQACETVFGKESLGTLSCMEDLAVTLYEQKKLVEAEELYRQALAGKEKLLGSTHPDVVALTEGLALTFDAQGHHKKAEMMIRKVIEKKNDALGPDHPETMSANSSLAGVLFRQGKLKAAAKLLKQTLPKRRNLLGEGHPHTLLNLNDIAVMLTIQGKYRSAVPLFRRALAGRQKYAEAETLYRDVVDYTASDPLTATANAIDTDAFSRGTSLWNFADLLHRQKRFEEACQLYERSCAEYAEGGDSGPHAVCAAWFADMQKEMERRRRGGVWRFDTSHALLRIGKRTLGRMASIRSNVMNSRVTTE